MNVKLVAIAVTSVVVWTFQVAALADEKGFVVNKIGGGGDGVFESTGWKGYRYDSCKERKDHMRAAAAFGTLAVLVLSVTMVVHIMLAIPQTGQKVLGFGLMGKVITDYLWVFYAVAGIFLLLTWGILCGLYDRQLCGSRVKWAKELNFGFTFFVINSVVCVFMAFAAYNRVHVQGVAQRDEQPTQQQQEIKYTSTTAGGNHPPPPNPIDAECFEHAPTRK
eukprot:TRINITY_DN6271_c1_g1_i2.p2 TRINITY_DN6271_c1_g1~~TRINITY_DN6271_c1_g1_i2.p2  ORF type:complete len:221 (+),score=41.89 TRINITY_DN6271_c1_g1_i2:35-697(+)